MEAEEEGEEWLEDEGGDEEPCSPPNKEQFENQKIFFGYSGDIDTKI